MHGMKKRNEKKTHHIKKQIGPQFEYNQFIRDYFADPKNKDKNRDGATKAWNIIKYYREATNIKDNLHMFLYSSYSINGRNSAVRIVLFL